MDSILKHFDFVKDKDLNIIRHGIAYQSDIGKTIDYTADEYQKKFEYYSSRPDRYRIINEGRKSLIEKYTSDKFLDIGCGDGSFVKFFGENSFGYELNKSVVSHLEKLGKYSNMFEDFNNFSMFDVLEHLPEPEKYFRFMKKGSLLFISIPIFSDLSKIRESRHYRPNEHLYYFTDEGFRFYMGLWGFEVCEVSDFESLAGRDSIKSYVLSRTLPDYHDMLLMYSNMHNSSFYGSSAMLYFDVISKLVVRKNPSSILDYGCGRSDLATYFWKDGERKIEKYDPSINQYKTISQGTFDLVLCTDVLEHIHMRHIERILSEIRLKSQNVIFTISLRLARTKLPNGQNAHVSILTKSEWMRWIISIFGKAEEVPNKYDHILMVKTY